MTRRLVIVEDPDSYQYDSSPVVVAEVRCDRCKHWIDREYCEQSVSWDGEPEHKETTAYASDKDSYHAKLRTKAEHGCASFSPLAGAEGEK